MFTNDFTDLERTNPYFNEIYYCREKRYITGDTATIFNPDGNLTRGQTAVVLCRVFEFVGIGPPLGNYKDIVSFQHYFDNSVILLSSLGIMNGTSETTFSPEDNITREQLIVVIKRFLQLDAINLDTYMVYDNHSSISNWATEAVNACMNADVLVGLYDNENLEPQKPVTRAEVCKLIYNIMQVSHKIVASIKVNIGE
ncbi:MAG: S-layer homology domain-containing protein [Eubacteriales bacterium]